MAQSVDVSSAGEFADPRLVSLYDALFPPGADTAFWLSLADDRPGAPVVDVGCGTGVLAVELARRGHAVTGVDPAPGMLEVARSRPGGELVRWLEGDATALAAAGVDGQGLGYLTSHVVQLIVDDDALATTFSAVRAALAPGGRLAFDSRSQDAATWLARSGYLTPRTRTHPTLGDVVFRQESLGAEGSLARYRLRYTLVATGEDLTAEAELRFRTLDELTELLQATSFTVDEVHGDWDRRPPGADTTEYLVVARAV